MSKDMNHCSAQSILIVRTAIRLVEHGEAADKSDTESEDAITLKLSSAISWAGSSGEDSDMILGSARKRRHQSKL